jgi:hypothetical protein
VPRPRAAPLITPVPHTLIFAISMSAQASPATATEPVAASSATTANPPAAAALATTANQPAEESVSSLRPRTSGGAFFTGFGHAFSWLSAHLNPISWFASKDPSTSVTLNTGDRMPLVGLGTWQSPKGAVKAAVLAALQAGYRHVDCAAAYGNEKEVGEVRDR